MWYQWMQQIFSLSPMKNCSGVVIQKNGQGSLKTDMQSNNIVVQKPTLTIKGEQSKQTEPGQTMHAMKQKRLIK